MGDTTPPRLRPEGQIDPASVVATEPFNNPATAISSARIGDRR